MGAPAADRGPRRRRDSASPGTGTLLAWACYDWANNAFATVILTFVFAAYFTRQVAPDPVRGTELWGYTLAASGLGVSLLGPLLGAVADQSGRRKPWLAGFTLLCVAATAALAWVRPTAQWVLPALVLLGLGSAAGELAVVFYNAMLPALASPERVGRWSGWGWSLGYLGGVACLLLALLLFLGRNPWLPLQGLNPVQATCVLVASWYLVFSLPLFLVVPDSGERRPATAAAVAAGWRQLCGTLARLGDRPWLVRFLLARTVYINGLATLFAFGGVYAAGTFGMDERLVLLFGVAITAAAGVGAALLSSLDDRIGPKRTVAIALAALIVFGSLALLAESRLQFWVAAILLGVFVGPVQSASRSYLARTAPKALRNELFGLYALSGKVVSFLGPLLVGWVTARVESQRAGMGVVIALFAVGFLLLLRVPPVAQVAEGRSEGRGAG